MAASEVGLGIGGSFTRLEQRIVVPLLLAIVEQCRVRLAEASVLQRRHLRGLLWCLLDLLVGGSTDDVLLGGDLRSDGGVEFVCARSMERLIEAALGKRVLGAILGRTYHGPALWPTLSLPGELAGPLHGCVLGSRHIVGRTGGSANSVASLMLLLSLRSLSALALVHLVLQPFHGIYEVVVGVTSDGLWRAKAVELVALGWEVTAPSAASLGGRSELYVSRLKHLSIGYGELRL